MKKLNRDYCVLLDHRRYNRNWGCKAHDNAYGINGGGGARERRAADRAFYDHMRANGDPMALTAWLFVRLFGWAYFNYHGRPWRGQLIRWFVRAP